MDVQSLKALVRLGDWRAVRIFCSAISETIDIQFIVGWFHRNIYTPATSAMKVAYKDVEEGAKACYEVSKDHGPRDR